MSNIKAIRLALGMTQQKFAERLGCTQSAVGQFERGTTSPSVEVGKRIVALAAETGRDVLLDHVYGLRELAAISSQEVAHG